MERYKYKLIIYFGRVKKMLKLRRVAFLLSAFILFFSLLPNTSAQEIDTTESEIAIKQMRLPIRPSKRDTFKLHSIDDEVAIIVSKIVEQLGLYEVSVGIGLEDALEAQAFQKRGGKPTIVNIDEIDDAEEALIVTVQNFSQKAVPPEETKYAHDEPYFGQTDSSRFEISNLFHIFRGSSKKSKQDSIEAYSDNIETRLSVKFQLVDIDSLEALDSFIIDVIHTGGPRVKSKAKTLEKFKKMVKNELKRIYWLSCDIVALNDSEVILSETDLGIRKGMFFELVEAGRIEMLGAKEMTIPGGRVGFVSVTDTSAEGAHSKILRQWRPFHSGSWAVEYPKSIHALQVNLVAPFTNSYISFGIQFNARPIQTFDWGLGLKFIQLTDSFGDKDFGFGFGGFGIWRFLNGSRFDLGGKLGIDLDIPLKKDDEGQIVNTALFSAHIGVAAEFLLSAKSDVVITAGYRLGVKTSEWDYSEDDETIPAVWNNGSPEVDNSGFLLSIGYKFFLF